MDEKKLTEMIKELERAGYFVIKKNDLALFETASADDDVDTIIGITENGMLMGDIVAYRGRAADRTREAVVVESDISDKGQWLLRGNIG